MLYFDKETFRVIHHDKVREHGYNNVLCRRDIDSSSQAHALAANVSIAEKAHYIAIDNGENHYPRYDVIKAPSVGDEVSYSFNGDTYPDGKIQSISETMRLIITDTGNKYYRQGETGCWKQNKVWSLVAGHAYEQNPRI